MKKTFLFKPDGQLYYSFNNQTQHIPAQCAFKNVNLVPPKIIGGEPGIQIPGCNVNCIFFQVKALVKKSTEVLITLKCCDHSFTALKSS